MLVGKEKSLAKKPQRLFFRHVVRKIFLEDWAMKVLALLITLGLWFGVNLVNKGKQITQAFNAVPLSLRVLDNAVVTHAPNQEFEILVRGVDEQVFKVRRSDLVVYVDLTELPPGEHVITLTPDSVSVPLPDGVTLFDLQPSRIAVTIEAVEEKEVAVHVQEEGMPAAGFEVYGESVVPQKVKVRGPSSVIRAIDQLLTEKISLDGRREDFTARQIPVNSSNSKVTIFNTVVDVMFRIGETRVEKTFVVPVTGTFSSKKATVVLYGPRTPITKLRPETLKVEITKNDRGEDAPNLVLPDALQGSVEIRKLKLNP
jgi:YbbR domain-containing protein